MRITNVEQRECKLTHWFPASVKNFVEKALIPGSLGKKIICKSRHMYSELSRWICQPNFTACACLNANRNEKCLGDAGSKFAT